MVEKYENRIFEYSPNLVKSSAVGHGHADKESVKKVLDMLLGKRNYETHDESDAVAVALCHILNRGKVSTKAPRSSNKSSGMAGSLAHKIKG
jgi:crossover junction endodeoxyribonuclease RuvC